MSKITRREFLERTTLTMAAFSLSGRSGFTAESALPINPNIVFIAIEDFSPQRLGCYGGPVKSPNMDRLAGEGVLFERAYAMSPVCNASRTSLFTGLRSDTTGVFGNSHDWRKMLPDITTMPMHLQKHGYDTIRIGKMYHGKWRHDESWTQILPQLYDREAAKAKRPAMAPKKTSKGDNMRWGPTGNDPHKDRDGQIAEQVSRFLEKKHDKPFFLGVGFHAPHLPFRAPDRFHDLYPPEEVKLPQNRMNDLDDTPLRGPSNDYKRLTTDEWREIVSSHYATISYADWCVGRVLDALKRTDREKDTIVIVWSDHGFMLGEHYLWRKVNLYEESARVAFIWRVPGVTPNGARCSRPVETIDMFPTLFDLCNIPQPERIEGISMINLLKDPSISWKKGAITWKSGKGELVAIQTERYRLNKRISDGFLELYDHHTDPGEFTNVAKAPEYRDVVAELTKLLDGGWKACLPDQI